MILELPPDSPTDRHWTFNDEVNQNHMLYIPANQPVVTAALGWKEAAKAEIFPVGKYRIDLPALESSGFVRLKDNRIF